MQQASDMQAPAEGISSCESSHRTLCAAADAAAARTAGLLHSLASGAGAWPATTESMDEWEKANPYCPPPPRPNPPRSASRRGEHSSRFHMTCQARGLEPEFSYRESARGCFHVTLHIDGKLLDSIGPYASKKDAKEEMCLLAMDKIDAFGEPKKRGAAVLEDDGLAPVPDGLRAERWINHVYDYLQLHRLGPPVFDESGVHPAAGPFRCTLTMPGGPSTAFGSELGPFRKKVDAKLAAAQQATQWLRARGLVPAAPGGGQPCKKPKTTHDPLPAPPHTTAPTPPPPPSLARAPSAGAEGVMERCSRLVDQLGFSSLPTFEFRPLPDSFFACHALFHPQDAHAEPRVAGPVGAVHHVYGKKEARRACRDHVVTLLEAILRDRKGLPHFARRDPDQSPSSSSSS